MIDIFEALGAKGAKAIRRSLFAFTGAGLLVLATGFTGAALVEFLVQVMPRYGALGAIALVLLVGGLSFLAAANARPAPLKTSGTPEALAAVSSTATSDWRTALQLALVEDAQNRPARAAALAALAGLILGAMEGLQHDRGKDAA